jgi:hypothetical protein
MHVKEIYVIFIHLFDSGILLIIDLNKKKREKNMLFLAVEQKYLHGWKAGDIKILYL